MANNSKQCFNTHYQSHCHPTTKSLWLCSSVYCRPPHQSRRIWLVAAATNQKGGDIEILWMSSKTIGHLFYTTSSFVLHFKSSILFKTWVTVRNRPIWVIIGDFLSRVTLTFVGWPWKTIGHPFYTTSSFVHRPKAMGEFKLELQSGNTKFGSKSMIFLSLVT